MRCWISRLPKPIQAFATSEWQDCTPLRWAAQLAVGGVPGLVICLIIMRLAGAAPEKGGSTHIASIIPLLSASGLADTPAFHRLKPESDLTANRAPCFRVPGMDGGPVQVSAAGPASMPAVAHDFHAPRTSWKHLDAATRAAVDATLARKKDWHRVVLHGSGGLAQGGARLLGRYQSAVHSQGLACHFVIGSGKGVADGRVEAGERWAKGLPAGDIADTGMAGSSISVSVVGDFNASPPSQAQLEALDELMDYLALKLGRLELTTHARLGGKTGGAAASCLGVKFPVLGRE